MKKKFTTRDLILCALFTALFGNRSVYKNSGSACAFYFANNIYNIGRSFARF